MKSPIPFFVSYLRNFPVVKLSIFVALSVLMLTVVTVPELVMARSGVGLLPPSVTLTLSAGDSGSYQLKVHNGSGRSVSVGLGVTVSIVPLGGSASDIGLLFPPSVLARSGNTFVRITVEVSPQAAPGQYILTNTLVLP